MKEIHMPNIGPMELVLVLGIALLVLGPKKLPDVGRSVGRGMREFKNGLVGERETTAISEEHVDGGTQPHLGTQPEEAPLALSAAGTERANAAA
jgi:sec-independent protein translocase protein TatA